MYLGRHPQGAILLIKQSDYSGNIERDKGKHATNIFFTLM